jgi:outer membrane protein assembly factor BamB
MRRWVMKRALACVALLTAVVIGGMAPVLPAEAGAPNPRTITVFPSRVHPGGLVTVRGAGFTPGATVSFEVARVDRRSEATVDGSGRFFARLMVPRTVRSGTRLLRAIEPGHSAVKRFEVGTDWPNVGRTTGASNSNPYESDITVRNADGLAVDWVAKPPEELDPLCSTSYTVSIRGNDAWVLATDGSVFRVDLTTHESRMEFVPQYCDDVGVEGAVQQVGEQRVFPIGGGLIYYRPGETDWEGYDDITGSGLVHDGILYTQGADGSVVAWDIAARAEQWRTQPYFTNGRNRVFGRRLFTFSPNRHGQSWIRSFDLDTGSLVWETSNEDGPLPEYEFAMDDGVIIGTTATSRAVALDADTGQRLWSTPENWHFSRAALQDGVAYLTGVTEGGPFLDLALRARDARPRWAIPHGSGMDYRQPVVANDVVFFRSDEGLVIREVSTGRSLGTLDGLDFDAQTTPMVVNGHVYAIRHNGEFVSASLDPKM